MPPQYPEGLQYEWYGVDSSGFVGVFNSNGLGAVPVEMVADPELYCRTVDAVRALPRRVSAHAAPHACSYDSEFQELAERGLFAFDWPDVFRPGLGWSHYELQALPTQPLRLSDLALPDEASELIRSVGLPCSDLRSVTVMVAAEQWLAGPDQHGA